MKLVRRSRDPDVTISDTIANAERELWQSCRQLRENIAHATNEQDGDEQFKALMRRHLREIEGYASTIVDNKILSREAQELELHVCRRRLALIYEEIEMCELSDPACRAVEEDMAYIACGRQCVTHMFYSSLLA